MKIQERIACLGLMSLMIAGVAQASMQQENAPRQVLFEIQDNELVPLAQVGDSVFFYEEDELLCDQPADEEAPCLATVDHWENVCFQGEYEEICPAFARLFAASSQKLLEEGAEEDVTLLSCGTETYVPLLTFVLTSYHGGPNVLVKDKLIPLCPIFFD